MIVRFSDFCYMGLLFKDHLYQETTLAWLIGVLLIQVSLYWKETVTCFWSYNSPTIAHMRL